MKKLVVVLATLLFGIAVGTAWTVVRHDPAAAPPPLATPSDEGTDAASHGASVAEEGAGDVTVGVAPTAAGLMPPVLDEPGTVVEPPSGAPSGAHQPRGPGTGRASAGQAAADPGDGAAQLGRIFGAMQARDAALVLAHLSDPEAERILLSLGARQAAAVLSNLEPERAAVLSRSVLAGRGEP